MNDNIGFGNINNTDYLFDNNNDNNESSTNLNNKVYSCLNCGVKILTNNNISTCPICSGNMSSITDDVKAIDGYIPFTKNIDEVRKIYKKKVMFNPIVPFIFKKKSTIDSITPVYVSATLNDANISGNSLFLGGNKTVKNQKLSTISKSELSYTSNFDYKNVLINSCSKIDDNLFNSICNYSCNVEPYNEELLNSICILSDSSLEDVKNKLNKKIMNHALIIIRDNINYGLKKLSKNEMIITNSSCKNILVPIYLLNINYNAKSYKFICNGENGNNNIKLPIGIVETIIFSILSFLIILLISFLFTKFF